jgi:hypothetical protein
MRAYGCERQNEHPRQQRPQQIRSDNKCPPGLR